MSIDSHVSVTLVVNNSGVSRQGFGTIGILSYKDLWADTSRTYKSLAALVADGFPADSAEAVAVGQILAQQPHAVSIKILKGSNAPTLAYRLDVSLVRDNTDYVVNVRGEGVTMTAAKYTSGVGATNDTIVAGLVAALEAVVGKNFTAAVGGGAGATYATVTGDAPGNWFSLEVVDTSRLKSTMTHADPGVAADLTTIQTVDKDWYYLHTLFNSKDYALAAAAWVESTPFKFYAFDVSDSDCENTAAGGGDVLDAWKALSRRRSLGMYSRKPNEMRAAALVGRLSPLNVGKWTAAYKTLSGCTADKFTDTQLGNLDAKRASYYKSEAGRDIAWEGKVGDVSYGYMDVTVSLDFVLDDIQKSVFGVLVAMDKVAYTDEDIQIISSATEGAIDRAKSDEHKIVAPGTPGDPNDPEPTVVYPRVKDIDPSVRAVRELPNGDVNFRLQGAVHRVDVNLTVSF